MLSKGFEIVKDDDLSTSHVRQKRTREDMQQQQPSVVTISAQERRVETETDTSFVTSLTPKLREEVLLAADEVFLSTLPKSLISEARQLQQRKVEMRRNRQSNSPLAMKRKGKVKRNLRSVTSSNCQSTGQEQIKEAAAEESHQEHRIDDAGGPAKFSELLPLLCNDNDLAERFLARRGMYTTAKELFSEATTFSKKQRPEEPTTEIQ